MFDLLKRIKEEVFIIAEIGNNHNGDKEAAKKLIDIAYDAGVDAVKFQTFRGIDIVTPLVKANEYEGWDTKGFEYWSDFLNSIALPLEDHEEVFNYAKNKGLICFSTPESPRMVDFLEHLNVQLYKVASMDINNIQLLRRLAQTKKPIIISSGMAERKDIETALLILRENQVVVMHCISDYPTEYKNVNLLSIKYIKEKFNVEVGFSDHSLGIDVTIASILLGARVIEKHITYSRAAEKKAEHHFSLEPSEFKLLVNGIRNVEAALGSYDLVRSSNEKVNKLKYRRSLHVNKDLSAGHILTHDDISVLRPATGATPSDYDFYIGKKLLIEKKSWNSLNPKDIMQ
ncbi:MAG: N-acetylneuraminate synthase family protein [Chitinophagaceae bacterium]